MLLCQFEGINQKGFGDFVRSRLNHRDPARMSGNDQIQRAGRHLVFRRVNDEFVIDAAHSHGSDGAVPWDIGQGQSGRCTVDGQYAGGIALVYGKHCCDHMDIVSHIVIKEGADGAIHHSGA